MEPELIAMAQRAHAAIGRGSNPQRVAEKFRALSGGIDLPSPAALQGYKPSPVGEPSDASAWPAGSPDNPSGRTGGDIAGKVVGALLDPVTIGQVAATMAMPPLTVAGNIATGGAMGAIQGAYNASPGERISGAVKGGLFGAATSAGAEAAGGLWNLFTKPGRMAAQRAEVGQLLYGDLDKPLTEQAAIDFVRDPAIRKDVFAVSKDLADGKRPPTTMDLQALRDIWKMRGPSGNPALARQATGLLNKETAGAFGERDALYRGFMDELRTATARKKVATKAAAATAGTGLLGWSIKHNAGE